jgi:hypothetical protein
MYTGRADDQSRTDWSKTPVFQPDPTGSVTYRDPGELLGEFLPSFFHMHSMYLYLAAMACRQRWLVRLLAVVAGALACEGDCGEAAVPGAGAQLAYDAPLLRRLRGRRDRPAGQHTATRAGAGRDDGGRRRRRR